MQRDRVSLTNIINATPVAAKCAVHPVVCGLLEAYIECPFHLGHSPICAVAKPGGTNEHGGWCVPTQHVRGPFPFTILCVSVIVLSRDSESLLGFHVEVGPPFLYRFTGNASHMHLSQAR